MRDYLFYNLKFIKYYPMLVLLILTRRRPVIASAISVRSKKICYLLYFHGWISIIFSRKIGGTRFGVVRFGQLHQLATDGQCLLDINEKAPRDRERHQRTVEKNMLLTLLPRLHHRDFFDENRWHAVESSPVRTTPPASHR